MGSPLIKSGAEIGLQPPPFLLLSGVIRLHDDAFLFLSISRSIREFCKVYFPPRLSTEKRFSRLRHAFRGQSPPKFSVFVKSRLHGIFELKMENRADSRKATKNKKSARYSVPDVFQIHISENSSNLIRQHFFPLS